MTLHSDIREAAPSDESGVYVPPSLARRFLKRAAASAARILVMPLYVSCLVRSVALGDQAFRASSQRLSMIPGLRGDYLRAEFYRLTLAAAGRNIQICFGTLFSTRLARVADNVYIGTHCMIGNAEIGRDVLLGSNVHLLSGQSQHGIKDLDTPIRLQARRQDRISIGADTWIGNGAIVMANIGRQCVIGAGSVVVSDIPERSIAAGNPARVIRDRA